MKTIDVVRKLIGPIQPVGECHTDKKRYENLKAMCELLEELWQDMARVAEDADRQEHSMSKAGKYVEGRIKELICDWDCPDPHIFEKRLEDVEEHECQTLVAEAK